MRWLVALAVVLVAGSLSAAGTPAVDAKARVLVVDRTPLMVRGLRFGAGETVRVRVAVRGGAKVVRSMVARKGGGFNARFASMWVSECSILSVQATGSRGSRASFTLHPPPCGADQ
jgi:hypothetical protein